MFKNLLAEMMVLNVADDREYKIFSLATDVLSAFNDCEKRNGSAMMTASYIEVCLLPEINLLGARVEMNNAILEITKTMKAH